MRKFLSILFIFLFFTFCKTYAATKYLSDENSKIVPQNPIFNKTITVPINRILSINISNSINSAELTTGDKIYAVLKNDFVYNEKMVAQEGSTVTGIVTKVSQPQEKKPAEILIKFTNIIAPNGQNIPISAIINTYDKTGILKGENGANIEFPANSTLEIIIKQPVTFISLQ